MRSATTNKLNKRVQQKNQIIRLLLWQSITDGFRLGLLTGWCVCVCVYTSSDCLQDNNESSINKTARTAECLTMRHSSQSKAFRALVESQDKHVPKFVVCFVGRQIQLIKTTKQHTNYKITL